MKNIITFPLQLPTRTARTSAPEGEIYYVPPALVTEASEWLVRLSDRDPPPSSPDFDRAARSAAFSQWVSRSDDHKAAFVLVCKSSQRIAELALRHGADASTLMTDYRVQRSLERKRHAQRWGVAAVVALSIAASLLALSPNKDQAAADTSITLTSTYTTKLGEHRCEKLPDDSKVCLNTSSAVHFSYSQKSRTLELLSGEASFEVRKGNRPFDVSAGRLLVRDIATEFVVYKGSNSTLVTVANGSVKITAPVDMNAPNWTTAPEFHRLQQVVFNEATGTLLNRLTLTESGLSQVMAWRRGRINLTGKRLDEALDEFSRYQPVERFVIRDVALRQLILGGEMETTHLVDFLEWLRVTHGVQHAFSRAPDGQIVVTLSRRSPNLQRRDSCPHHGAIG